MDGFLPKYLFVVLIFLLSCLDLWRKAHSAGTIASRVTFPDYLLYTFRGMHAFVRDGMNIKNVFDIPPLWMIMNLYLAYLVGNYPTKDLYGYGQQILIRSRSRRQWWAGKVIWNLAMVLVFYFTGYLVLFGFTLFTGTLSFQPSAVIAARFCDIDIQNWAGGSWLPVVLLQPVMASISLCFIQMAVSFFIKPVFSYLSVVCLLVLSAYYDTPFLVGNCAMILRSRLAEPGGIELSWAVLFTVLLSAAAILIGGRRFRKMDVLDKA